MYQTLISAADLKALPAGQVVIVDCRHQLTDPAYGRAAYAAGHLPGARFLHLDEDLSGPKTGRNGRHPLPDADVLAARLGQLGIGNDTQVVAYDDAGGMYGARLWWLLNWLGHAAVAVLDGGVKAWLAAGGALTDEVIEPAPTVFTRRAARMPTVDAETLLSNLDGSALLVIDARSPDRYAGQNETIDPVAGHIPGAANRFFQQNLTSDGTFKSPDALRAEWGPILAGRGAASVVQQCGSGVTACHNLLAMTYAGLPGSRLYPGSWSEWCSDPARPVAVGAA